MPLSKNPNAYADVRQVFDAALRAGGGKYTLKTPGKAQHWMQRAYTFRKILFNLEKEKYGIIPGYSPSTPYDQIILQREGNTVYIGIRKGLEGTLTDADGNPMSEAPGQASGQGLTDEELETARRVARDLDLDIEE